MRIGVIAPPWAPVPPVLYGGTEAVVDRLARGYRAAGHDVLLFTTGDATADVRRAWALPEAEGTRMGMTAPELRHVIAAYDAVADCDVVHDHTLAGPVYASRFPDRPTVTTAHGHFDAELAAIYRRVAPQVPLIAISHAQRRTVPDIPVTRVIHHGVDVTDFPEGDGQGGYALFLGRMSEDKGAHRAIDVAAKAGVVLKMAAKMRDPWEFDYFERMVRPRLGPGIEYLGEVPHAEKLQLLAGAQALVNPIRWPEPFGLVMLEALACGTPVLAFAEGAAPEIVASGRTGFLCADEGEMALRLSNVGALSRTDCRAAVAGYFSTARMVDEHLQLFEQVIAGWPRARGGPVPLPGG